MVKQSVLFKRTLVIGIIIIFIGMNVNPSTGIIVEKTTISTIGSRGYIQDLIDNASDGDTIYIPSGIYYESIVIDKSISLIGEDKDTTIIDVGGLGFVCAVYIIADNVSVSGFTITNNSGFWSKGIMIHESDNIVISGNIIQHTGGCGVGIGRFSDSAIIIDNIIMNQLNGICIDADINTIIGNTILDNSWGIQLHEVNGNTITGNIISKNSQGMNLYDSINNTITGNTISNNGIRLINSSNNTIIGNNISNTRYGIRLQDSSNNNDIYHNNFIENTQNAYDYCDNIWDNGYPSGGNYWDDYNGTDSDEDGIGDTPYSIPRGDNEDRYPLMYPTCNVPPNKPIIDGTITGKPGIEYEYTFNATDLNDDAVMYIVDWGDDNNEWTEYGDPGVEIILNHTWDAYGKYKIKAKAIDIHGNEGEWAEFPVSMPRNKAIINRPFLNFLQCHPYLFPILQKLLPHLILWRKD